MGVRRTNRSSWPEGRIPYTINSSDFPEGSKNRKSIVDAIGHWNAKTVIHLSPRKRERSYATFVLADGSCTSAVGMSGKGEQKIRCHLGKGFGKGSIIHEIGHAVGLWHEHTREDRRGFVDYHEENVAGGKWEKDQFKRHIKDGEDVGDYDYRSIMHYGRRAFAKKGKETLTPLTSASIGQRRKLSRRDVETANQIYGVYNAGAHVARHGMTAREYRDAFDHFAALDYRLVDVSGYTVKGKVRYVALWKENSGVSWVARHGMTSSQYQKQFDRYVGRGYRLSRVSGYGVKGIDHYAAIWVKSTSRFVARHRMTSSQYQSRFNEYAASGYRLTCVSGYRAKKTLYAAVWRKSNAAYRAHHGMTSAQYRRRFDRYFAEGYILNDVSGYTVSGKDRYAAIWRKEGAAFVGRHRMSSSAFQDYLSRYAFRGFNLKAVSGYSRGGKAQFAALWIK